MDNQNSVAYVGVIGSVTEINGADNIELVMVNGWQAITKKGEYMVGDFVVIATTDAIIPLKLSDEMGVTGYLRKGQRVRTVKLRGVYSECLIIPTKYIPGYGEQYYDGKDMMGVFGITKYEPPVKTIQLSVGGRKIRYDENPNFHIYYKFPNQKNVPDMFNGNDEVVITRKLHGTNARYGIVKKRKLSIFDRVKLLFGNKWARFEYVMGSHNVEKGSDSQGFYDENVWEKCAFKYDMREVLWQHVKDTYRPDELDKGFIIYGEIYGAGIQKNYDYGLDTIKFAGFDVEVDGVYESYDKEVVHFKCLNLPQVDMLYRGLWCKDIQDKYVFDNFILGGKVPHEGVVVKGVGGERNKISKVINPSYLIYGENNNVGDSH